MINRIILIIERWMSKNKCCDGLARLRDKEEAFETNVLAKFMSMDADCVELILGPLLICSFPKFVVPRQKLSIVFPIVSISSIIQ